MKKILLISLVVLAFACNKKKDDPAPASNTSTNINQKGYADTLIGIYVGQEWVASNTTNSYIYSGMGNDTIKVFKTSKDQINVFYTYYFQGYYVYKQILYNCSEGISGSTIDMHAAPNQNMSDVTQFNGGQVKSDYYYPSTFDPNARIEFYTFDNALGRTYFFSGYKR